MSFNCSNDKKNDFYSTLTITEFESERQYMNLVSLDSDNGHTILLKSDDGTLRKPSISIKGKFGELNV